jgi:porin
MAGFRAIARTLATDFQYITAPSGGDPDPNAPGRKIGDAALFGLRSTISF